MPDRAQAGTSADRLFAYPKAEQLLKAPGQSELLLEFLAWAREVNASLAAHRALCGALIATHDRPEALLDHFQQGMDMVADAVPADQVEDYRREMQLLQGMMLNAVNRMPKP